MYKKLKDKVPTQSQKEEQIARDMVKNAEGDYIRNGQENPVKQIDFWRMQRSYIKEISNGFSEDQQKIIYHENTYHLKFKKNIEQMAQQAGFKKFNAHDLMVEHAHVGDSDKYSRLEPYPNISTFIQVLNKSSDKTLLDEFYKIVKEQARYNCELVLWGKSDKVPDKVVVNKNTENCLLKFIPKELHTELEGRWKVNVEAATKLAAESAKTQTTQSGNTTTTPSATTTATTTVTATATEVTADPSNNEQIMTHNRRIKGDLKLEIDLLKKATADDDDDDEAEPESIDKGIV